MIWLLVAHRADARLFRSTGRLGNINLVRELDFPEGRRQNREIDSDANGSRYSTTGRGNSMHVGTRLDPQMEAAEHISETFAKELAVVLRDGRTHNEYDEIILVAEPGFLGKLRKFLDKETGKMVSATHNRNLSGLPLPELVNHLNRIVHDTRKVA